MEDQIYQKASAEGLQPRRTPKGYSIICPKHEDRHHSAIIFSNDGFAACFAGCGRWNYMGTNYKPSKENYEVKQRQDEDRISVDYFDYWLSLDPLDEDVKGIPAAYLNSIGWRKLPSDNQLRLPPGIFIPAFNGSRTRIPFCQVRHLSGDRRFSFPSRVKPLAFGMEVLGSVQKYVAFTEGNSDRAVLQMAGIQTIGIPSGASGSILRSLGEWAREHRVILVAVSDNDPVGDSLLRSLDSVATYIDARPIGYKDINDMYQDVGIDGIRKEYGWLANQEPSS